jgi:hypothetical protein
VDRRFCRAPACACAYRLRKLGSCSCASRVRSAGAALLPRPFLWTDKIQAFGGVVTPMVRTFALIPSNPPPEHEHGRRLFVAYQQVARFRAPLAAAVRSLAAGVLRECSLGANRRQGRLGTTPRGPGSFLMPSESRPNLGERALIFGLARSVFALRSTVAGEVLCGTE